MKQYTTSHIDFGEQTYTNELESIINTTFNTLQFRKTNNFNWMTRGDHLVQYRTLWMLRPRVIGTTSSISAMFDHTQDLYIGIKWSNVESFLNSFEYIQKLPKCIAKYALLNRSNLSLISDYTPNIKRVFIDVGGAYCIDHPSIIKKIKTIITNLEKLVNEDTIYIIT